MSSLERCMRREDERYPLVALRQLHTQRCRERPVKAESEAVVAFEITEVEIRCAARDLHRVVEDRGVEESVYENAPLGGQEQTVAIAKAPTGKATQRRAAAKRGKHEERNRLALVYERRFDAASQREHPGVAHHRDVLNHVVVNARETVLIVQVIEVMTGYCEIPTGSRVAGSGAPVEGSRRVRM